MTARSRRRILIGGIVAQIAVLAWMAVIAAHGKPLAFFLPISALSAFCALFGLHLLRRAARLETRQRRPR